MNISLNKKKVKTADGYDIIEDDILYHYQPHMYGYRLTKFKVKHWTNGGKVYANILLNSDKELIYDRSGYGPGVYPSEESNAYCAIPSKQVFKLYKNVLLCHNNRLKKMQNFNIKEKDISYKSTSYNI